MNAKAKSAAEKLANDDSVNPLAMAKELAAALDNGDARDKSNASFIRDAVKDAEQRLGPVYMIALAISKGD